MIDPDTIIEWNPEKARRNEIKHGISFQEAATVFEDENAYVYEDEAHSDDEPRKFLIGYSNRNRQLAISFVERGANRIRLITARRATGSEKKSYAETRND